jgi:GNAT superfamily N-acetyltransferase
VVDVREIRDEELPAWVAVVDAGSGGRAGTVEDYLDWRRQAKDMGWLLAEEDGEPVGAAVALCGWHTPPGVGRGEVYVVPEARGRGAGSQLFRNVARWVSERGCIELESSVREDDPESLAWVQRRGFREVGRNSTLVLDLEEIEEPAVDPPDGIEIVSWAERPGVERGMYQVALEAYPDIPGQEDEALEPFETWLSQDLQGSGDRPEATFVALAGDEVVGYAKLALSSARPEVVMHDVTGVRRAWRGRGIAGALKRAEIAWAKRSGYRRLETTNEERNEPIRRLNERHGYRVEPGSVTVRAAILGPD